ncbi:hypothetical protein GP486_007126 [Trichoglossum hirsutum]|uniref:Uncharacterized protein n=1 Tax=Trichoglossum hirsutum TaxID=265104 RepID=A0A9P8L720_9PEZI|nr:hypothetical protein GP486_007126 [Trichoglossum hirsutum]
MVKAGHAAPRDRNAPPADGQEVRGVDNPPQLLGHMGPVVANAVGSFAYGVREAFRSPASWFRRVSPLGQPPKDTVTKTLPVLELPLRIDVFPWLDLDDPVTFAQSPYEEFILRGIADARASGLRIDDFDTGCYAQYSAAYDDRYPNRGQKGIFFDALEYPDNEFGVVYDDRYLSRGRKDVFFDALEYPNDGFGVLMDHDRGPLVNGPSPHLDADDAARLEAFAEAETAPPNRRTNAKKSDIPKKLSFDEWIARERTFHDSLWAASRLYEPMPPDTIYIAQDKYRRNILAVFPNGLEIAYGYNESDRYIANTIHNLEEYARSQPPPIVEDCRHTHHAWWIRKNPHLRPPDGRCGVVHWGTWPELGKNKGPLLSKDTMKGGTRSNPKDGAYAWRYRRKTIRSLGPLTRAVDLLFQIVDKRTRDGYLAAFDRLDPDVKIATTKEMSHELFPLRAVLFNTLTEEHIDSGDWEGGWAWLGIFGKFAGGDFCLPQLGVSVPMPAGSIVGIRGTLLKHFVTPWQGQRYSVVHFFKESLRERPPGGDQTKDYAVPRVKLKTRMEIRTSLANAQTDLEESQFTLTEQTKRKRRNRNRRRKRAQEIRKMVAYNHVKPEDWYTAQE